MCDVRLVFPLLVDLTIFMCVHYLVLRVCACVFGLSCVFDCLCERAFLFLMYIYECYMQVCECFYLFWMCIILCGPSESLVSGLSVLDLSRVGWPCSIRAMDLGPTHQQTQGSTTQRLSDLSSIINTVHRASTERGQVGRKNVSTYYLKRNMVMCNFHRSIIKKGKCVTKHCYKLRTVLLQGDPDLSIWFSRC